MEKRTLFIIMFVSGICLAVIGAGIMFHGNVFAENNSGIATIIGILGIGLIGASGSYRAALKSS
jgi:anthranilate phosphoribosyltransferase